jgi:hypothetical protein
MSYCMDCGPDEDTEYLAGNSPRAAGPVPDLTGKRISFILFLSSFH